MDWQAVAAGAAAVSVVGAFLGWICKMTIENAIDKSLKDYATKEFVNDKVKVHEDIFHKNQQ
jgi:hypothetical protein